ncbi:cysteine desulfurase NifS, partial [Candidatus Gottesmanbacteria bacterium RBG_13_37_7]
ESNNTVLKGISSSYRNKGDHVIISAIEHDCIMECASFLEKQDIEITRIPVNKDGLINPEDIRNAITPKTILVSVMHANNEIGTIQPIAEIGKICRAKKVFFHTDASQSLGKIPLDAQKNSIDLLTASSHKLYGPKGVGLLYIRNGISLTPLLHGGGHEKGIRSSTVNVPSIAAFTKAVAICQKEMKAESQRLTLLRDKLITAIQKTIPHTYLNGHATARLPNNINLRFMFVEGESILMQLDKYGFAVSTGSACSSRSLTPSHVLTALGLKPAEIHGSVRITLGRWTKEKDLIYLLKVLPKIIKNLRKISPFSNLIQ